MSGMRAISTFVPASTPQVVFVDDIEIRGPFCATCGYNEDNHVHGKVQGGKNKGKVITACPPPQGNPMDTKRCWPCTQRQMGVAMTFTQHRNDGLFHQEIVVSIYPECPKCHARFDTHHDPECPHNLE